MIVIFKPDFSNAVKIIDSLTSENNTVFEVVEYIKSRQGYYTTGTTSEYPHQTGEKLRQVRININNGGVLVQPGALQFVKGPITIDDKRNLQSNTKKKSKGFFDSVGTGEASITSRYYGKHGEIYLDPSYKHYYILELSNDELILDDGMFFCCEDSIEVSVHKNKNISAALVSGDGFRQPKLSGSGIAILESDIPLEEILIYELNNETLKIDGNYSIVIRGKIETTIEKSKREGYLQTFDGTGEVWIAPSRKHRPINC